MKYIFLVPLEFLLIMISGLNILMADTYDIFCSSSRPCDITEVFLELWMGVELRQGQIFSVALFRDWASPGGISGLSLVPLSGVSFVAMEIITTKLWRFPLLGHLVLKYMCISNLFSSPNAINWNRIFLVHTNIINGEGGANSIGILKTPLRRNHKP